MITQRLQLYVNTRGVDSLLHFGPKITPRLECELHFATDSAQIQYSSSWVAGQPNGLVFEYERIRDNQPSTFFPPVEEEKVAGLMESSFVNLHSHGIISTLNAQREIVMGGAALPTPYTPPITMGIMLAMFGFQVFHFHDTSDTSPLRKACSIHHNRSLEPNGENLPSMLYLYREAHPTIYNRIVASIRAAAPYFDDFVLEPLRLRPQEIALEWRMRDSTYVFNAYQLSDGTLRFIALSTLLQQPEAGRPPMLILDEPELGLHPAALSLLAEMLKSSSNSKRTLVGTQSPLLLDHFYPADVVTVNLRNNESHFERLDSVDLRAWLDDEFSLSNLWERNVIGGGPYS